MTVAQARRVLGSLAQDVSDEQILEEIELAEIFKNVFFRLMTSNTKLDYSSFKKYTSLESEIKS